MFQISLGDKWAWVTVKAQLHIRKIIWNKKLLNSLKKGKIQPCIEMEKNQAIKQAHDGHLNDKETVLPKSAKE